MQNERGEYTRDEVLARVRDAVPGLTVTVHTSAETGYGDFLRDGDVSISVKDGEQELFIDVTDELTLSFKWWHSHYSLDKAAEEEIPGFPEVCLVCGLDKLLYDLRRIIRGEVFQLVRLCDGEWLGSELISMTPTVFDDGRHAGEFRSREELRGYVRMSFADWWERERKFATEHLIKPTDSDEKKAELLLPPWSDHPTKERGIDVMCVFWDASRDTTTHFDADEILDENAYASE